MTYKRKKVYLGLTMLCLFVMDGMSQNYDSLMQEFNNLKSKLIELNQEKAELIEIQMNYGDLIDENNDLLEELERYKEIENSFKEDGLDLKADRADWHKGGVIQNFDATQTITLLEGDNDNLDKDVDVLLLELTNGKEFWVPVLTKSPGSSINYYKTDKEYTGYVGRVKKTLKVAFSVSNCDLHPLWFNDLGSCEQ